MKFLELQNAKIRVKFNVKIVFYYVFNCMSKMQVSVTTQTTHSQFLQ